MIRRGFLGLQFILGNKGRLEDFGCYHGGQKIALFAGRMVTTSLRTTETDDVPPIFGRFKLFFMLWPNFSSASPPDGTASP